jgi:DNA-binding HxlR family transcriptional regulator
MLSRVGDKWTVLVVTYLGEGSMRFSELQRRIGGISQKMLTVTLRNLERDGFVSRTVEPSSPPRVSYELTALGHELLVPVTGIAEWTRANIGRIEAARQAFDRSQKG